MMRIPLPSFAHKVDIQGDVFSEIFNTANEVVESLCAFLVENAVIVQLKP